MAAKWLKRAGGTLGLCLSWAGAWAVVAVIVGLAIDPDGSMDEMWPAIGGYPGFLSAALFSGVLWVAERRRGLREVSLARAAAWGAVAGLLVGIFPFTIGEATTEIPLWVLASLVIGSFTIASTVSAVGTALWFRRAR